MISNTNLFWGVLIIICASQSRCHGAGLQRMCAYYDPIAPGPEYYRTEGEDDDSYDYQEPIPAVQASNSSGDPETIICDRNEEYCYASWSLDSNQNMTLKKQGCWSVSDTRSVCDNTECVSDYDPVAKRKYLFCCCVGNLCNSRLSWKVIESPRNTDAPLPDVILEELSFHRLLLDPIVWLTLAIIFLLLLTLILIAVLRHSDQDSPKPETAPLAPAGPGYSSNLQNVDNLKLVSLLGQGKYGTVWKGMLNERSVAVKIFPEHHKQYFQNEKDIYNVPLMDHKSLLTYFGCDERRTIDDRIEYMLVLSLAQMGCLQDWLVDNTNSFSGFCKMATGIAQGLSHLHTAMQKGDLVKPSICHRDLNTRNILVRSDLSCCLCDYGFAMKMTLAETRNITEVGTLRYMAPEILEGAVNLKDCDSALKQIDVYALGLVLWELATRCHDFYFDGRENVPIYQAPYEADVGKHPSYEQMQIAVSRQKIRPKFPSNWGCGLAAKVIRETCEDSWDADSEARLTSLCVEERLKDLWKDKQTHHGTDSNHLSIITHHIRKTSPIGTCAIISSPPNRIYASRGKETTDELTEESTYYAEKQDVKPLTKLTGKGPAVKPVRKDKFQFKLPGKRTKKNKIEKSFQGWHGVQSMIQKKLFKRMKLENDDLSNSIAEKTSIASNPPTPKSVAVRPTNLDIIPQKYFASNARTTVTVVDEGVKKVDPKPRRSSSETKESAKLDKKIISSRLSLQPIPDFPDPPGNFRPRIVVSKSANTMRQIDGISVAEHSLKRQRSLEVFREVFGSRQSTERLRDPSQRVKTPGDVPPSVRKTRASKTLSLYDDRMMGIDLGNSI